MTVWHMRIEWRIPKATNTNTICNNYCIPTARMVTRTSLKVTLYVRCLSCNYCIQLLYYTVKKGCPHALLQELKIPTPVNFPRHSYATCRTCIDLSFHLAHLARKNSKGVLALQMHTLTYYTLIFNVFIFKERADWNLDVSKFVVVGQYSFANIFL